MASSPRVNAAGLAGTRTIYLDFDGTLHDSLRIYAPVFRTACRWLAEEGQAARCDHSDEAIAHWLGYSKTAMWEEFMPDLPEPLRDAASRMIGQEMVRRIQAGEARLYDGALEVLAELHRRGIQLVFFSNCSRLYMDACFAAFDLDPYFAGRICAQDYDWIPKARILAQVRDQYPAPAIIVGDRFHDMDAGAANGIPTVFCSYGFGKESEGASADYRIDDIAGLPEIIPG